MNALSDGQTEPAGADGSPRDTRAQRGEGRHRLALDYFERALALWTKLFADDAQEVAYCQMEIAEMQLRLGDRDAALIAAEAAVAGFEGKQMAPRELARTRFALAAALPASERPRALELARQAREGFVAAGPAAQVGAYAVRVRELEAWLARTR